MTIVDKVLDGEMSVSEAMCMRMRTVGILSIRGYATNYWARLAINGVDEVCTTLESGYDHQSIEDSVYALFQSFTEWSLK